MDKNFRPTRFPHSLTVRVKILFQQICLTRADWDSELQGDYRKTYLKLLSELKTLNSIRIPRALYKNDSDPVSSQIHGFSDAFEAAFAGAVYLRTEFKNGEIDVRQVASKTKVAPLARQTIPRLELLGAGLLSGLVNSVKNAIKVPAHLETHYWTDSSCCLAWIRNNRLWKRYVNDRVKEIRKLASTENWHHCPGVLNPADLPTRGLTGEELKASQLWQTGPAFLKQSKEHWPKFQLTENENEIAMSELVKNPPDVTHILQLHHLDKKIENLINFKRFSSKLKVIRVTGWILPFVNNLKNSISERKHCLNSKELEANELKETENFLVSTIQRDCFSDEINFLNGNSASKQPPVYVKQFNLFFDDDNILRCKTKLQNAPLDYISKNPILLPKKHAFTDLVIKQAHEQVFHNGIKETVCKTRQTYWVPCCRELVKRIIRQFFVCKKLEGKFFDVEPIPALPENRVTDSTPFCTSGLDFLGPLYVHSESVDTAVEKVYVCLYTCSSTRAIHLKLCKNLKVTEFLMSFRRFSARRGLPCMLISDKAKTFTSSSPEIRKIVRSEQVKRHFANKGVTWKFILERAAWIGGIWERMVRSVKRCLKKVLGRSSLNFQELRTLLPEIESVLNARPLTYVFDDQEGISYPLTPAQLIYGRNLTACNDKHFEVLSTNKALTKRANYHRR